MSGRPGSRIMQSLARDSFQSVCSREGLSTLNCPLGPSKVPLLSAARSEHLSLVRARQKAARHLSKQARKGSSTMASTALDYNFIINLLDSVRYDPPVPSTHAPSSTKATFCACLRHLSPSCILMLRKCSGFLTCLLCKTTIFFFL